MSRKWKSKIGNRGNTEGKQAKHRRKSYKHPKKHAGTPRGTVGKS